MKTIFKILSITFFIILTILICGCIKKIPEVNQYIVTFKDYDGTILREEIVEYGYNATAPKDPVREGYIFVGWDNEYTNIRKNTILVAQYRLINQGTTTETYTVTFITNSDTVIENQTVEKGEKATEPINPIKEGYIFDGWYLDNEKWSFIGYSVTDNIELVAKWNIITYKITYELNDGTTTNSITYTVEDEITLNNPTKVGYTFIGWTSNDIENPQLNVTIKNETNDKHFIANYTPNKYTITFDVNGGIPLDKNEIEYDSIFDIIPIRVGYTFLGWYNGNTKVTNGTWKYASDVTLIAKWQINTYNITYDLNESIVTNPITYTVEDEITLNNPTKVGYTFIGWTSNDIENPQLNVTIKNEINDKHFIANYTPNKYTITFDVNGGLPLDKNEIEIEYDSIFDIIPVRVGYTFLGWYNGNTKVTNGTWKYACDVTLKAKWFIGDIYEENGYKYINFGRYPQTVVTDETTISALLNISTTNSLGYIEYNGNEYKKVVANTYSSNSTFINGNTIIEGNTYYFLVEPIKWRVLEEKDGTYKLLCEMIIDNTEFYDSLSNRTIKNETIYANNYEYSNIRAWLNGYDGSNYNVEDYTNKGFLDIAFTEEEKLLINTTLVDNSLASTGNSNNRYICNNTKDKVYLLSVKDTLNINYGFSSSTSSHNSREAVVSDYARSKKCYMYTSTAYYGNGHWWLRSLDNNVSDGARVVDHDGFVNNGNYGSSVDNNRNGVRPALTIII